MHRTAALVVLLLALASIPGCAYASWLVVTGGGGGWQLALLSLLVLVASVRIRDRIDPGFAAYAILALALAVPLAAALPLAHVGHYARYGGPLALVLSLGGAAVIALFIVLVLIVGALIAFLVSMFKIWS